MNLYSIALFVHIVGALLLFVLLTIEGVSLRAGIPAGQLNRVLGPISGLAILVPGLELVAAGPGWKGWAAVGFTSWVLIAVASAVTGVSLMRGRVSRRTAAMCWTIRVGMALGVGFDMTVKPAAWVATVRVVVALALHATARR